MPESVGLNSENAAHRVAVLWDDEGETREGASSHGETQALNSIICLGGRVFLGEHHQASFNVSESSSRSVFT